MSHDQNWFPWACHDVGSTDLIELNIKTQATLGDILTWYNSSRVTSKYIDTCYISLPTSISMGDVMCHNNRSNTQPAHGWFLVAIRTTHPVDDSPPLWSAWFPSWKPARLWADGKGQWTLLGSRGSNAITTWSTEQKRHSMRTANSESKERLRSCDEQPIGSKFAKEDLFDYGYCPIDGLICGPNLFH